MAASNYDPELEFYVQMIINVNVTISFLLFPLVIYLILTQSKILKNYKWYLLNSVCCCQLYEFFILLFIPNFLFPSSFCVIINTFVLLPKHLYHLYVYVFGFAGIMLFNQDLAVIWSVVYRYSQSQPGRMNDFFEKSRWIYAIYAAIYLITNGVSLIAFASVSGGDEARRQFLAENPDLVAQSNRPIVCFTERAKIVDALLGFIALAGSFVLCGIGTLIILYSRIKRSSKTVTAKTYALQLMCFRALAAQLTVSYLFLLLPAIVASVVICFEFQNGGKIGVLTFLIMSVHSYCDYAVMIFYITPYRRRVLHLLSIKKEASSRSQVSVLNVTSSKSK